MGKNASNKIKYYEKLLKKHKNISDFYTSGQSMLQNRPKNLSYEDGIIYETSVMVTAPVLISYVIYILSDAQKRGLERLYFLSRDGYVMYKIAMILCENYGIDIECRYLYVSRLALRAPLYLIDKNEAMERFCEHGVKISPIVVLQRAGISEEMQQKILDELNIEFRDRPLTDKQLKELGQNLKENTFFKKEALSYAEDKYKKIYKYFMQEGLLEEKEYAIVDVGWIGSMQRHIRQIITYSGNNRNVYGYYFAMFENGKTEDGTYNCFYFSKQCNRSRRVLFNNELFECMCSANHGMTIGYNINDEGTTMPILKDYEVKWNVDLQLDTVEQFTKKFININKWTDIRINQLPKLVKKLLISFMIFPSLNEATVYGRIPFCDDFTESYMVNLADELTKNELRQYSIFYKIYKKILLKGKQEKFHESFWINGTIQLSNISCKTLFTLSCVVCEYIHYLELKAKR